MKQYQWWTCYFLVVCALAIPCHASAFLSQDAKIVFDERNYVVFEDVGRVTRDGGFTAGSAVRLHVTRDGQSKTVEPAGIASQVDHIHYADKDHVWITARLGHMGYGVALVNLASGTTELSYSGLGESFAFSPDGKRVAYLQYAHPKKSQGVEVYVNDLMVFPIVKVGVEVPQTGEEWVAREKRSPGTYGSSLRWRDDDTLTFLILKLGTPEEEDLRLQGKLPDTVENNRYERLVVSGLASPPDMPDMPRKITVERTALTPEDTKRILAMERASRASKATDLTFADNSTTTRTAVSVAPAARR